MGIPKASLLGMSYLSLSENADMIHIMRLQIKHLYVARQNKSRTGEYSSKLQK